MGRKPRKGLVANLFEELGFVLEIKVDGGRRVLDFFGDATHGDVFVTILDEKLAGGVEDLLAEELFLAKFAFFDAHGSGPLTNLTTLSYSFCFVKPFI